MSSVDSLRKRLIDFYEYTPRPEGEKIVRLQNNLEISYKMAEMNYLELTTANEAYLTDHGIEQPENVGKLNKFLLNFQRLLFNYLNSFVSFLDHAEVFVKEIKNPQLRTEFDKLFKQNSFAEKKEFAKDLKKYVVHYNLPFPRVETFYLPTPTGVLTDTIPGFCKGELSLRKNELLKWKGFKLKSKNFLFQNYGNVIILVSSAKIGCVDQCNVATKELFQALNSKVDELFKDEISDFKTLKEKYKENLMCLNLSWKKKD